MSAEQITVEAMVTAPVETAWRCWTEPDHITQWNFASDDWCCPRAESDLQVGGRYRARMEAKDGSFGFDFEARFEEVEPPRAITLLMGDGRRARTTFAPADGMTRVTTAFDAEAENSRDMQRDGWQAILDNFKSHVEHVAGRLAVA